MDDNGQDSRQRRRGIVDTANNAFSAGRTIWKGAKLARTAGAAAGAASSAGPIVAIVGGVLLLVVLISFGITYATGEAAGIPEGGQSPTIAAPGDGNNPTISTCSQGPGLCSPQNLARFGTNANAASIVCWKESTGVSDVINNNCLLPSSDKRQTLDYSVGLFQINLIAHCNAAFDPCTTTNPNSPPACPGTAYCKIGNQSELDRCVRLFSNVEENLSFALNLWRNGGWGAWGAARACGIL